MVAEGGSTSLPSGSIGIGVDGDGGSSLLSDGLDGRGSMPVGGSGSVSVGSAPGGKFRRFSELVGSVVSTMAKSLGLSTDRQERARKNEKVDTPRRAEEAALSKAKEDSFAYRVVLTYYGHWEPPPVPKEAVLFYERVLLPKVSLEELTESLKIRSECGAPPC
jgi:hypothetical protein